MKSEYKHVGIWQCVFCMPIPLRVCLAGALTFRKLLLKNHGNPNKPQNSILNNSTSCFVILVCGILFDHVPDRTVISQGFSNTISSGARIDGSGIKYAIRGERFSEQMPIVCLLRSTARNTGYLSRTPLVLAGFGSLIFLAVLTALLLHLYAKGHDTGSRLRILRWLFRTDGKKRTFHIG